MRQFLRALHQPVRIEPFEGVTGCGMEHLSPGGEQTVVCHFLRQGMFEDVDGLRDAWTVIEKLQVLQFQQYLFKRTLSFPHLLEQGRSKFPTQDSSRLQQTLVFLWETI